MALNSPMRRMFGVPGSSASQQPVSVGAQGAAPGAPGPSVAPGPPVGKGVLIRSLERHGGSPAELVQQAQAAGLTWVGILSLWQYEGQPPANADAQVVEGNGQMPPFAQKPFNQDIMAYAGALQQAGISPWLWGHPLGRPDAVTAFVQVVGTLAAQCGAGGVLVEPRQSWAMQSGIDNMAANLIAQLRQQSGGRPVGVMSYATPAQHPLPWSVFAQTADFGSPWSAGEEQPDDAARAYAEQGFRTVVPVVGPEQNPPPAPSLLWWDWHELSQKQRWDAVRNTQGLTVTQQPSG